MMLSRAWQTARFVNTGFHVARTACRTAANAAGAPPRGGHRYARSLGRPRPAPPADLRRYARCRHATRRTRKGCFAIEALGRASDGSAEDEACSSVTVSLELAV